MFALELNVEVPAAIYETAPDGTQYFQQPGMYDATFDVQNAGFTQGQMFDPFKPVTVTITDGSVRTDVQTISASEPLQCPNGGASYPAGEPMGYHYGWVFDLMNPRAGPDDGGFSSKLDKCGLNGQFMHHYSICNVRKEPKRFTLKVEQF